ncbi:mechanosensitive ion channel family protein [Thermodesulfobacteriota bacterium]
MRQKPCPNQPAFAAIIIVTILIWTAGLSSQALCQTAGVLSPKKEKPGASIKVEVKEGGDKKPAEVKVEVGGKEYEKKAGGKKGGSPLKVLPAPEERMAPVDTKRIDKAGKKVGEKIDEVSKNSSYLLGDWVTSKAFNGIIWLKLISTALILLMVLLVERLLNYLIKRRLRRIESEERAPTWFEVLLEALRRPLCLFMWVYGSYFAISPLFVHFDVPFGTNVLKRFARITADVGGMFAVIWFIFRVVRLVDLELETRAKSPESRIDDLQVTLVGKTLRWVIVIVGSIFIIQLLTGFQAGPFIASLGIGGLAVALAAKESIANLFGTVTIVFDRPFKVGDRIIIDKHDGFVESVGYRSTGLRLWNGNLVNIPNQKITNSNVENCAGRPHIWWRTDITITYDTPPDKVDQAVEILNEILVGDEETSAEKPPWVFFSGFNDWSLNIRVTAWFTPFGKEPLQVDYYSWRERNCRQILRRFNEEGIQFAFPTRTTHLANDDKRQLKLMMLTGDGPDFKTEAMAR